MMDMEVMTEGGNNSSEKVKKRRKETVRMATEGKEGNRVKRNKCKKRRAAYNGIGL